MGGKEERSATKSNRISKPGVCFNKKMANHDQHTETIFRAQLQTHNCSLTHDLQPTVPPHVTVITVRSRERNPKRIQGRNSVSTHGIKIELKWATFNTASPLGTAAHTPCLTYKLPVPIKPKKMDRERQTREMKGKEGQLSKSITVAVHSRCKSV